MNTFECHLFPASTDCYHSIATKTRKSYSSFYIKINKDKKIIHMFNLLQLRGTSLINLIDPWLIKEILFKTKAIENEDEIYNYSAIIYSSGYSTFGLDIDSQDISFFSAKDKEFEFRKFTKIDVIKNADFSFIKMLPYPQEYLAYEDAKNMLKHLNNEGLAKIVNLPISEIEKIRLEFE